MRTLRFLCVGTLIAAVAASVAVTLEVAASETQSAEERVYAVRRARTAPIIDGVVDDPAWEGVTVQVLDRDMKSGASWANAMDFAGEFRAVWREGSLYVAMEFEDDYVATDRDFFERSDRVVLRVGDAFSGEHRTYTVPVHEVQSLEDPSVPFATWSYDGRVCEFSVDTGHAIGEEERWLRRYTKHRERRAGVGKVCEASFGQHRGNTSICTHKFSLCHP